METGTKIGVGEPRSRELRAFQERYLYIQILQSLPHPQKEKLMREIESRLSAYSRHMPGKRLPPNEQIQLVEDRSRSSKREIPKAPFVNGLNIEPSSVKHSFHYMSKVVDTATAYVLVQHNILNKEEVSKDVKGSKAYGLLCRLEREHQAIGRALKDPYVSSLLTKLPHFRDLIKSYYDNESVDVFYRSLELEPPQQLNWELLRFLLSQKGAKNLRNQLTRCLFAKYVKESTNWFDEPIDDKIAKAINVVYETPTHHSSPKQLQFIIEARHFFNELLRQELSRQMHAHQSNMNPHSFLTDYFVPKEGRTTIRSIEDVNIPETYKRDTEYHLLLKGLTTFAETFVSNQNSFLAFAHLNQSQAEGLHYSLATKRQWLWAGRIFLENVLLSPARASSSWSTLSVKRNQIFDELRLGILEITLPFLKNSPTSVQ